MKKWLVGWMCVGMFVVATVNALGGLIISQYYEGASNNKWIEIYNPGPEAVDLGAGNYRLGLWANAAREAWKTDTAPNSTFALSNSLASGGTYLIRHSSATNPAYATAQLASGSLTFNGDDSLVLYTGTTYAFANVVDAFGMTASNGVDRSFVRKTSVTTGVNTDFNAADWDEFTYAQVDAAVEGTNERLGYHNTGALVFGVSFDKAEGFEVEEGTATILSATAVNGTAPYAYAWDTDMAPGDYLVASNSFGISGLAAVGSYYATVTATDSSVPAQVVSNTIHFSVVAPAPKYAIAIVTNAPANGTVTTTPATEAEAGQTVTVNAAPAGGYAVQSIAVVDAAMNPVTVTGNAFTMPAAAVTVTVTFMEAVASGELIISQYYEGASNNKWIEIYNPGSTAIDLAAGGYRIGLWANANREAWKTGTAPGSSTALSNSIPAGGTFLIKNSSAVLPAYAVADMTSGAMTFTGDDSVVLYTGATYSYANVVDAFGCSAAFSNATDKSYVRKSSVVSGVNTDFNAAEWDEFTLTQVEDAVAGTNERLGYHSTGAPVFGVSFDKAEGFEVEEGTATILTATAANGTAPYAYGWDTDMAPGDYLVDSNSFGISGLAAVGSYYATVTATDSSDPVQVVSNTIHFSVVAPAPKYAISIVTNAPANGTVTTTPATEAEAGQTVTVNAVPAGGYRVASIVVNGGAVAVTGNTFTMPAEPVVVTATFEVYDAPGVLIDFETNTTLSASAYTAGTSTVSGVTFAHQRVLRGNLANDRVHGVYSGRFYPQGGTNAVLATTGAFAEPITKISLWHANYGTDNGTTFKVQVSPDGAAWEDVGGIIDPESTTLVEVVLETVPANATYLQIVSVSGATRINIDDIGLWFGAPEFGVSLNRTNGFAVVQGVGDAITATAANGTAPYLYSWASTLGGAYYVAISNVFTILATAPTGSYSATVTATDDAAQTVSNTVTFSVTAPAPKYAIAIVTNAPANGTVTTTPATEAEAGQTVTVNATPAGGYAVQSIAVVDAAMNPVTVTGNAFTMPAAAVTVTVTFVEASASGELIISQYYEGTSNNKWIEIYNPGSAAIDLAAGAYRLGRWDNANREAWKAGIAPSGSVALSNSIPAGGTYLIGNTSATNPAYAVAGQLSGVLTFTGDDSVVLYKGATYAFANVVDAFGMTATNAMDRSFVRKTSVTAGVNADFNAAEWDEFSLGAVDAAAESTNERLGYHSIGASALGVSLDRTNGFTVAHGTSAAITATATGGTAPYGYSWTSTLGEGYRTAADNVFTILATAPAGDYTATVTATDGAAQTASNTVSFTVLGGGGETWQIGNPDTGGGMFYSTSNQTIMIVLPTNYTLSAVYGTDSSGAGLNNLGQGLGSPLTPGVDYNWNPATRTISVLSGVTNRRVLRIGASSP